MASSSLLSRLTRPFQPRSTLAGRELQLHLDTATLYKTLPPQRHVPRHQKPTPEQQHVASLLKLPSALPPFEHQATALTAHLHANTTRVLRSLAASFASHRPAQTLRDSLRFSLHVEKSSVAGAGRGVFVDGLVRSGSVATLYPGVSYLPSQVRRSGLADEGIATQADYFISRYDGVVIDGSADVEIDVEGVLPEGWSAKQSTETSQDSLEESQGDLMHPLGLGHLVNHPPPDTAPNVLQFMFDLDLQALPRELRPLVPCRNWGDVGGVLERVENEAFRQRVPSSTVFVSGSTDAGRITRTVALVAIRDIQNEELFMNYRFNPNAPGLPDWYWDCDPEESSRRWKPKGVFY